MINLKRKIIILSLIFFVYLLFSCGRKNDGGIGDIRKIDLAGLSVYNPFIKGNQLDSIKIVKLATDTNCLLGGIIKVIIEDSLIFIRDANEKLFVFDLNGKFRNMIGVMGNGPLEYTSLSDFYVNCQKKFVCILDRIKGKIYRYTFDGQYIEEFDCDRSVFNNVIDIHYVGENKLLLNMNNHIGTLYNYALVNESSYKLEQFLHPYPVVSRERISNRMLPTVVYGNGNIFYTVLLSDTIYTIQDGESRPIYLYEGGLKHINYEALQQETPYQSIFEAEMKLIKKGYSGGLLQLFQLKDHLYFEICQGEECWNIFWNLKEQTGFKYNSCLPGIRIFPGKVQTVYENYIVRSISALDLKTEYFRKHNFKDSRIDAVSREVLEDDNPVLLFYYVNTERLKK